jgi:hypothetical protein
VEVIIMSDFISFIEDNILIAAIAGGVILLLIIILIVAIASSGKKKKKVMNNMQQQNQFAAVDPNMYRTADNLKTEALNANIRNVQPQARQAQNIAPVFNQQNAAVNNVQRNTIPEVPLLSENEKTEMLSSKGVERPVSQLVSNNHISSNQVNSIPVNNAPVVNRVSAETELLTNNTAAVESNLCETQLLTVEEPQPKARLKYISNGIEKEYEVKGDIVNIGRDPQLCEFALEENHVGRKHAMVYVKKQKFFLVDLSSKNGTFVNGEKVVGEKEIFDKDIIKFGTSEVTFLFD